MGKGDRRGNSTTGDEKNYCMGATIKKVNIGGRVEVAVSGTQAMRSSLSRGICNPESEKNRQKTRKTKIRSERPQTKICEDRRKRYR